MMNERGKSNRPVLPMKFSNKAGPPVAERMEGRGLTKGNPQQQNASRTPSRIDVPSALERIRQAASKDKEMRFTALSHHLYAVAPSFAFLAKGGIGDRPQTSAPSSTAFSPERFCSLGASDLPGFPTSRCWRRPRVRLSVKRAACRSSKPRVSAGNPGERSGEICGLLFRFSHSL